MMTPIVSGEFTLTFHEEVGGGPSTKRHSSFKYFVYFQIVSNDGIRIVTTLDKTLPAK